MSTFTSLSLYSLPSKSALVDEFVGQPLSALRTPALIVDRKKFKDNCERVASNAKERGMKFRAHVKSKLSFVVSRRYTDRYIAHKTTEGTRMQVEAAGGIKATIASTMVEVWQIIEAGLVKEDLVDDVHLSCLQPDCRSS